MSVLTKLYLSFFGSMVIGVTVGRWFEQMETDRLTGYRDKSALFGRELKPGEPPSWP